MPTLAEPTITTGLETVATIRHAPFSVAGTYTYVHSREGIGADRTDIPLTPRHSAGLVGMWEREDRGRIGVEVYFTGNNVSRTIGTGRRAKAMCSLAASSRGGGTAIQLEQMAVSDPGRLEV